MAGSSYTYGPSTLLRVILPPVQHSGEGIEGSEAQPPYFCWWGGQDFFLPVLRYSLHHGCLCHRCMPLMRSITVRLLLLFRVFRWILTMCLRWLGELISPMSTLHMSQISLITSTSPYIWPSWRAIWRAPFPLQPPLPILPPRQVFRWVFTFYPLSNGINGGNY